MVILRGDTRVRGAVAVIGNFDGVHLGHQQLLAAAATRAKTLSAPVGAVVFDPHPRRFFRPDDPAFLLTTHEAREALLRAHGADAVYALTFDASLAGLSAAEFVDDILVNALGLKGVFVGAEFQFGHNRKGDAAFLKSYGAECGLDVTVFEPELGPAGDGKIGSTGVRDALFAGNVKAAAAMLGRQWCVSGVVMEGQKLGRQLGFPTGNLTLGDLIEPRHGVYAVRAATNGETYNGVANFGRRPTVGSDAPLLEAHLFDFDGDLYGRRVDVSFVDFLREEKKFGGIDELAAQIKRDCKTARDLFAN